MQFPGSPPVDLSSVLSRLGALEATALSILPGAYTIGSLASPGTLPTPDATNLGSYAVVTDLYGSVTDKMLCRKVGSGYYWVPVRPALTTSSGIASSVTLGSLTHPPIMRNTAALTAALTVTYSTVGAWPGDVKEFVQVGATGIFSVTLAGLAVGNLAGLLTGAHKRHTFDGTAWQDIT